MVTNFINVIGKREKPLVSGCHVLDVVNGEHLLIADGPEQFAEQTVCLLEDRVLWQRVTTSARQLVASLYDWDVIVKQPMQIYDEVAG